MADLSKTVAIIFEGDDKVIKVINEVDTKFGALSTTANNIAAPFASAADAVLKVDAALAALAIGGLAYAYTKSVEFESAMVGFKKVAGDSVEAINAARTSAFDLSNQYGESAAKVLNSTTDFVQAGYNTQEAMMLTKAAMDLKIAGDIEASQSSEMLISILKGFNAPASEATRVIDILNEVSNKYATDVEQLGLGMSKLAPIAKTMGFSFEETAGMLTPVIEVFRSGPEAADALKTGLLKLIDDAKPVREALASIGVAQTDANGKLRSGKDILFDVAKAFETLDQNQKLFVTSQLVGIEQSARMVQVFDNLGKVTEVTNVALNSSGSAAKEVGVRLESSAVQIDRFKVGFENLGIVIGDKFRESATKAIAGGNEIMNAFQGLVTSGTFNPIFDALSGFSQRLYDYLKVIAQNLPAAFEKVNFSGLLDALGDLGDAFGSWFDNVDLTTVDGLAEGLQTLVDIITGLVRLTEGMVEAFKPFVTSAAEFFVTLAKGDEESQKTLATILVLAKAVEMAGVGFVAAVKLVDEYKISITGLFNVVSGGAQILWNGMQLIADSIQAVFVTAEGLILSFINKITMGLASLFPAFKDAQAVVEASGKKISASIDTDGADARRGLDRMIEGFNQLASGSKVSAAATKQAVDSIPTEKKLSLDIKELTENANKATAKLFEIPDKKETVHTLKSDTTQYELVKKLVKETLPDGTVTIHEVYVNEPVLAAAKAKVDAALPKEKKIDVQLETAKIKAEADVIQTAIQWKAKIDIAQAEQATKQLASMLKSVDAGIDSTGDLLGSLYETYSKGTGGWAIFDAIEKEQARRDQEFELQKQLIEKQLQLMEEKRKLMASGEQLIKIESSALQPHLEMILWEILTAIQVRANEEAAEFLLGVSGVGA